MSDYRELPHWTRDSDDEWAICVPGEMLSPGETIVISKADGTDQSATIIYHIEESTHGHLYKVDTSVSDRIERSAETVILRLNEENKSAEFVGSEGEIYETTLHSCTCPDFKKRNAACKHMYRLVDEFGDEYLAELEKHLNVPKPAKAKKGFGCLLIIAVAFIMVGIFASGLFSVIGYSGFAFFAVLGFFAYLGERKSEKNADVEE